MSLVNNDLIITIAIITHGGVINLELNPSLQNLLENVRLFSRAGEYKTTCTDEWEDIQLLHQLYPYFRKTLHKDTLLVLNDYKEKMQEIDERKGSLMNSKIYENITIDKIFRTDTPGFFSGTILSDFFEDFMGIFLISIHRKISETDYEVVWPTNIKTDGYKNINLLDVTNIKRLFEFLHPDYNSLQVDSFIEFLYERSQSFGKREYDLMIDNIEKSNFSPEEKKRIIQTKYNERLDYLQNNFIIDIDRRLNKIMVIRLTTLVDLIKRLVGNNCRINLLDYACNHIIREIHQENRGNSQYLKVSDIENPPPYSKKWGGKRKRKLLKKATIKKKGTLKKIKKNKTSKKRKF
jgi:hypothetical protein